MAKEEKIEVEGKVVEITKDTVTIELSPYDLTRGRIIWNKR